MNVVNFPKKERWAVYTRKTGVDIIPIDDLGGHDFEICGCKPTLDETKNGMPMYVHHSFDGREIIEEVFDKL